MQKWGLRFLVHVTRCIVKLHCCLCVPHCMTACWKYTSAPAWTCGVNAPMTLKRICHLCLLVQSWPKVLRMTQIYIFTKSAASVCMMAICIYSRMLWRVIRWSSINCKVPFLPCKWTESPKNISTAFQSCHKRTSWHHVSDYLVLTRTRLEITLSCWLSSNNRLEA